MSVCDEFTFIKSACGQTSFCPHFHYDEFISHARHSKTHHIYTSRQVCHRKVGEEEGRRERGKERERGGEKSMFDVCMYLFLPHHPHTHVMWLLNAHRMLLYYNI